jgi:UDP-N-acetylglucosamine 1-carboxyvinyltransferase
MSDKIRIFQSLNLAGEVEISGAKNSILPILAASLLSTKEIVIENVPDISDVWVMLEILREIGSDSSFDSENNRLIIFAKSSVKSSVENFELSEKIRTSSLFLGPLLAINGEARVPQPGGCKIGARLIDMHLHFFREMGAQVEENNDFITLKANNKIVGIEANFYKISVGATQNIMIAAVLAVGRTIINGASLEPEVEDLGKFLIAMGAKITGLGTSRVIIDGVESNVGLALAKPYKIISDRLEIGSFITLALATKSRIKLKNTNKDHINYVLEILKSVGGNIELDEQDILVDATNVEKFFSKSIVTAPYPYFPTDLQQIFVTLMCIASGFAIIEERIFNGRFLFTRELIKMGAKIYQEDDSKIIVDGVEKLYGAEIYAHDLRGSMALLIAGLVAEGETVMYNSYYLERGYEKLMKKLINIGVRIEEMS